MTYLNGLVGHHGAYGCRFYCPVKGRHKPGGPHYYLAHLKPDNYNVAGCGHPDINLRHPPVASSTEYHQNLAYVQASPNDIQYKERRKATGISKLSIFSGLRTDKILGIPGCFGGDLMHLVSLNIPDLLIPIWRGTMECEKTDNKASWDWAVLQGDIWKSHGQAVTDATPYLLGTFD